MKLRKNWKRFWTLDRHHAEGFTLVELIVVIAILAILGGVAVPAYSGYVKKANMQADMTLISEIEHALALQYYSKPGSLTQDAIVLVTTEGTTLASNATFAQDAMDAAFGAGWTDLALKCNEYSGEYTSSSYYAEEKELLGQVDNLANALASSIAADSSILGDNYNAFLRENGLENADDSQKANAAVLYIAQNAANSANKDKYVSEIAAASNANDVLGSAFSNFEGVTGIATMYAFAEGFFQYVDNETNGEHTGLNTIHSAFDGQEFASIDEAKDALLTSLGTATQNLERDYPGLISGYFAGGEDSQAVKDVQAYLDIMETVSTAKSEVLGEITNGQNFEDSAIVNELLDTYASGGAWVVITPDGITSNTIDPTKDSK